ncbi:MAG: hypothetical protein K2X93_15415 [Candidatus Obscuribacterales bacterium]|nr:hypothetical protein [Candidatus Obscuribacterales bacterium]
MLQLAYVRMIVLQEENFESSFAKTWPKFWCVMLYAIAFYLLLIVWVFIWTFSFGIAGVLAKISPAIAIVMIPILLIMVLLTVLSLILLCLPVTLLFVVLACEDTGVFAVLGRSIKLSLRRFFRTFGFVCSLGVSWVLLYTAMTSVLQIMYFVEYQRAGIYSGAKITSEIQLPILLQMIGGLWNSIVYMYLMPVLFLAAGYFYYSIRTREEGLDMSYQTRRLLERVHRSA